LIVGLGMGALFALPVAMFGLGSPAVKKSACEASFSTKVKKAAVIFVGPVDSTLAAVKETQMWLAPQTWYKGRPPNATGVVKITVPNNQVEATWNSGPALYLFLLRWNSSRQLTSNTCYGTRVLNTGLTAGEKAALTATNVNAVK